MAKKSRRKSQPLMYVHQPNFAAVRLDRRFVYVSGKKRVEPTVPRSEHAIEQGVRKQAFADKTIEEKLLFLMNLPTNMPPVTCEFRTNEHRYEGKLIGYTDEAILILPVNSLQKIELPKAELSSIVIIRL